MMVQAMCAQQHVYLALHPRERHQLNRFVIKVVHAYEHLCAASTVRSGHAWRLHLHRTPAVQ